MTKVYVGTTNNAKVNACREVLKEYEIVPLKTDSKVSNQPKTDEETITGAYNRAMSLPKDGLRIGLEAGVQMHMEKLFLVNWGVLIDEDDNVFYAGGTRIELPEYLRYGIFEEGKEMADIMGERFKNHDIRFEQGAIGILTSNQVKRIDIFIHIVKLLYGEYLYKKGEKNEGTSTNN